MTTTIQIEEINGKIVLPLSRDLLDELGVQNGGEVQITKENGALIMRSPQNEERRKLIEKYTAEIFEEHREVLQALAEGAK